MTVHQKLGMILENKMVQKLKLKNNVFNKKWSPKLIFLNDFFLILFKIPIQEHFEDLVLRLLTKYFPCSFLDKKPTNFDPPK